MMIAPLLHPLHLVLRLFFPPMILARAAADLL